MFTIWLLVSAAILLLLDAMYLFAIRHYFNDQVHKVQGSDIKLNYFGIVLCYLILILGLNYFIIRHDMPILDAFLLGILIYGVYEATNWSILENWSIKTVIIDTLWGGAVLSSTTAIVYAIRDK